MRFKSCRWRRPPDEGTECCGHRDVLPIAGTTGFDPEAWCPECAFYKLRRTPKKRSPDDYGGLSASASRARSQLPLSQAYSENSFANSTHSPCGASSRYAFQCGLASCDSPIFSNVTAR